MRVVDSNRLTPNTNYLICVRNERTDKDYIATFIEASEESRFDFTLLYERDMPLPSEWKIINKKSMKSSFTKINFDEDDTEGTTVYKLGSIGDEISVVQISRTSRKKTLKKGSRKTSSKSPSKGSNNKTIGGKTKRKHQRKRK